MNRGVVTCPLWGGFPARAAPALLAMVMLTLVFGSAIAQTRSDKDPRLPVQPMVPTADRLSAPPRIIFPAGPRAEISPSQRIVMQGQRAVFDSKSIADPDVPINLYQWSGPGKQTSRSERFIVDTSKLKPSEYKITLVVHDRQQREGRDSATLIVRAEAKDDVKVGTPIPIARINPPSIRVNQGARVSFSSTSYHPDRNSRVVRLSWHTQWGQTSAGNSLEIDTRSLNPGTYWITLDVTDQRKQGDSARAILEVVAAAQSPVARIKPRSIRVNQGARVSFSSASYHPDRNSRVVRSSWHTQWGQTSAGNSLEIDTRSLNPGTYWITIDVTDQRKQGDSARAILEVVAAAQSPVARINPKPLRVRQGEFADFDGGRSIDRDGKIRSWIWTLNDKRIDGGPSARIDTRALRPGEYRVRLQVTDDQGLTASDEALLIVAERAQYFDAALVELDVSPTEIPRNREVRIRAVVANRGETTLRNLPVRFEVGGGRVAEIVLPSLVPGESREVLVPWLPKTTGEQIIIARVNPENQPPETNRTNNLLRRSILVFSQPELGIDPAPLEVMRGDIANFSARVTFPPGQGSTPLEYFWHGPGDRSGNRQKFEFGTSDLLPGIYKIVLEVSDKRGFKSAAETNLTIRRPATELWLAANDQNPPARRNVVFTGGIRRELRDVTYKFFFGDGEETDWMAKPEAEHRYEKAGDYRIRMLAQRSGVDLGEASIGISVQETAFAVSLSTDANSVRTGQSANFRATVHPAADNVEFFFRFGDDQDSGWTRSPTASHLYSTDGTFAATVEARIGSAQVFRSPAVRVGVTTPPLPLWLWLAIGIAVVAAAVAAAAFLRKKSVVRAGGNFSVVPRVNLEKLQVETQGRLDLACEIGLRAVRGQNQYDIEAPGSLLGSQKD